MEYCFGGLYNLDFHCHYFKTLVHFCLIADRLGFDPAVMSAPLITTVVDTASILSILISQYGFRYN